MPSRKRGRAAVCAGKSNFAVTTLRIKLWIALLFVLALVATPTFVASKAIKTVSAHFALSDASAQSLSALQRLTVLGYTLQQERFTHPADFAQERESYVDGVRAHVTNADRYLNNEIRLLSETPLPPERRAAAITEEMSQREQLQRIGTHLERALLSPEVDTQWEDLALAAINVEEREVKTTQRISTEALASVIWTLAGTVAIVGLLGLLGVLWAQRQIIRPLRHLWRSTQAIAEGEYAQRVPSIGTSEFRAIAGSFNVMAEKIEAAANSMRQTNDELERAVARRTRELAATNRSLERANRLRQQFLADASHEMRTPLSIMRSEAEITLRDPQANPETLRGSLDRVVRHSKLMAEIIEDMLQIARAEEPLLQTNIAPLDAVSAVHSCVDDFRRVIEADGGTIHISKSIDALMVEGDETRLKQVIRIVVDNAVCYSSEAPEVDVTVAAEDGEALITVTDHGNGIAAEDIPHLFQRFRRGSRKAGTSPLGNGQGLGLSIARSIMEAMGGTISLASQLQKGTTVSIRLPLMSEAELINGTRS